MSDNSYKYQPILTNEDADARTRQSPIELTSGKPNEENYRSIATYQSAFSYSRQIHLHTLTGTDCSSLVTNERVLSSFD
jgi:hypothetical protein